MSTSNDNAVAAIMAFLSGAVVGTIAALLLAPAPGNEMREKLSDLGENATDRVKKFARDAKFRTMKKTRSGDYLYDGGDAWI
jgi:gas vesicle protein